MAESYEHLAVRCAEAWVRFCYEYAKERDGGRKFRFGDAPEWSKKERSDAGKACDAAFDAFADAFDARASDSPTRYAIQLVLRRIVNGLHEMEKEGAIKYVMRGEWGDTSGGPDKRDGKLPNDLKLFDSIEEAEIFVHSWKPHPWYCRPRRYNIIAVEPRFKAVLDGYVTGPVARDNAGSLGRKGAQSWKVAEPVLREELGQMFDAKWKRTHFESYHREWFIDGVLTRTKARLARERGEVRLHQDDIDAVAKERKLP